MQRENINGLLSNNDYTKQEFSSSNEISPLSDDCLKNQKIMNSLNDVSHENTSSKNDENKNLNDNVNGDMRKNYANENVIQKKYIDSNNFVVNEDKNSNNFVVNEDKDSNNFVVNEDKDLKHFVVDEDKDSNNFVVNEDKDSNNFVVNEDKIKNDLNEYDSQNEIPEQAKLKRQIFIILICVNMIAFLGSFSYWMQSGVLPYLTRKIGVNPQVFGYMQSTFALYQLVGSPLFGRFGDVFGCRICLVVSEIASAVAFGSLAFATNVAMLFLSRVPAIFMHNLQGSYMIITDCTLPSERANYLGKLGVSHGIGMIVGSFTGGLITEYFGDGATAIFAACGNLLCAIIVCIFIPDDTKAIRRKLENITSTAPAQSVGASLGLKELLNIFKIKIIRYLLFIKILSAFPFALLYSMFSMAIMDFYKQGPRVNGIILAYLGSLSILIQGILIGLLTSRFLDPTLVKLAVFLNTGAFMFLIVADNIYLLCVTLLPMAIGGTVSHIVITAAITKVVPIEDTGSALGLTLSFHALIRSIAPTFGGFIFTIAGWPFIGVIGYSIHLFLSVFVVLLGKDSFDSK
ncbi:solute carrier family 22 member 18 [Hydra vulgaris]|uniref:solute carrier family 22 member 18 n=1 Tax=Hydra vulgaris TaxID=6087 RepID=UPI001F5FBC98|nr:solute carrier family 22 member 18 [Hydra vulgaris]